MEVVILIKVEEIMTMEEMMKLELILMYLGDNELGEVKMEVMVDDDT